MNPFKITAHDFHAMFYQCFEGPYTPTFTSEDNTNVKYALIDLLTASNDDAIIGTINKIKTIELKKPKPAIFNQLQNVVNDMKIKNGLLFLKMFTLSIDGPQFAKVKTAILEAIKALQADFRKYNATDLNTINKCLSLPVLGLPMVAQNQLSILPEQSIAGYFKEGGKTSAKLIKSDIYKDEVSENLNYFSEQSIDANERAYPQSGNAIRNYRKLMGLHVANGGVIDRKLVLALNPVTKVAEFITSEIGENDDPRGLITMTMHSLIYHELTNGRIGTRAEMEQFVSDKFENDFRFNNLPKDMINHFFMSLEVFNEFLGIPADQTTFIMNDTTCENNAIALQSDYIKEKSDPFKGADMFVESSLKLLDQTYPDCSARLREFRTSLVNQAKNGELLMVKILQKQDPKSMLPYYKLEPYQMVKEDDIYPFCLTMQALVYDACINGLIKTEEEMSAFIEKKCLEKNQFFAYISVFGHEKFALIATLTHDRLKSLLKANEIQTPRYSFLELDS